MKSKNKDIKNYIQNLPEDRKLILTKLREVIIKNLPKGFEETLNYGMISYFVPLSIYPDGYHCNPKEPLPFLSIANQKNHIAIYHMGIYANEELYNWFVKEFITIKKSKPNISKSCIRFKKIEDIPFELIAKLISKISVNEWIDTYETKFRKTQRGKK